MQVFGLAPTVEQPQGHPVHGCPRCGGAWVDCLSMQTILAGASAHAAMAGHGTGDHGVRRRRIASGHFSKKIVYRPCPACGHRMMRKNFARVSGIIVDECGPHGSFFDAGELEGVIEFVRSGGLHLAQRKDADEQARLRKTSLTAAAMRAEADAYPGMFGQRVGPAPSDTLAFTGFLGWAGRWLRRTFD